MPVNPFITDFYLDRLWYAYEITETRRKRGFYLLFSTTAIYGLLWITNPQNPKIPILGNEVDLFIAMLLGPPLILVLNQSYFYHCSHTIRAYIEWLKRFVTLNEKEIQIQQLELIEIHGKVKIRDVTEQLNPFYFGTTSSKVWDQSYPVYIILAKNIFLEPIRVLVVSTPAVTYTFLTTWIWNNFENNISGPYAVTIVALYGVFGISFLIVPLYFWYRVMPARRFYDMKIQTTSDHD